MPEPAQPSNLAAQIMFDVQTTDADFRLEQNTNAQFANAQVANEVALRGVMNQARNIAPPGIGVPGLRV